jgi:CheY-like chemotaxis protein
MYASTILKKWGCKLDEAENGQIALEKVRKNNFDVILMDIHMPILDGIEASRTIRTTLEKPKSEIPIVAFTANALKGDKNKYLDVGMNAYISKPFMPEELFKILSKYFVPDVDQIEINKPGRLINLSNLRKMSNNDEQFVKDMIGSFVNNTPNILNDLSNAKNEQNWKAVSDLAHKLKSNLAFMGIDSLRELVIEIEHSGKKKEGLNELPGKVELLISKVEEAIAELASL